MMQWGLLGILVGGMVLMSGCATEQTFSRKNPKADLPLRTREVLVVYENSKLKFSSSAPNSLGEKLERIDEKLEKAVFSVIPKALQAKNISSQVANASDLEGIKKAAKTLPMIYVTPVGDSAVCHYSNCSHRMTIAVKLRAAATGVVLWESQIQEPYFVSSFVYDRRFEELAEHVAKAIGAVVVGE